MNSQFPDTWIIVDLEATCWNPEVSPLAAGLQRQETEIIEIGAYRFCPATQQIDKNSFSSFVRPVRHPKLTPFCMDLTQINQSDVADAPLFPEVYTAFDKWVGGWDNNLLAAWGLWDGKQLHKQATAAGLEADFQTVNVKDRFHRWLRNVYGPRPGRHGLASAVRRLGMSFEGEPHRALSDAWNTARISAHILSARNASPHAQQVLKELKTRDYLNVHQACQIWPDARRWWSAHRAELGRLPMISLCEGQGVRVNK